MSTISNESKLDDALTKRILISHDIDDRRLDSEHLLHFVQSILISNTSSDSEVISLSDFELIAANEPLGHIISKASQLIICTSNKELDLSQHVMSLFDLLTHYGWDAKAVLVLASFAMSYGEIRLVNELYHKIPLAKSVSDLRQIPRNSKENHYIFKALRSFFEILTDLTRTIIRFCALPTQNIPLDDDELLPASVSNTQIHAATYWVIKATLICSSKVIHLLSSKSEQVHIPSPSLHFCCTFNVMDFLQCLLEHVFRPAIWELTSLATQINSVCNDLKNRVDASELQIERALRRRLENLRNAVRDGSQEVLEILFGMRDDFPLQNHSSQTKPKRLSELKNKVVLLLISAPNLDAETLILLTDKLYHHPKLTKDHFHVVWVPILISTSWCRHDERSFNLISKSMPWWSVRRPWRINRAVIEYITQVFCFNGDQPVMPVFNTQGAVVNSDALSMALVWGSDAFPFTDAREFELWENAKWSIEFLLNDIDPLVSTWIEEGRQQLCIVGGNDAEWIEQFSSKMKVMIDAGLEVRVLYLGQNNLSKIVNNIFRSSDGSKVSLAVTGLEFFWHRIESLRRSKLRTPGANSDDDKIIHHLEKLLNLRFSKAGWAIFGTGKDEVKILQGMEVMELLTRVSSLGETMAGLSSPKIGPCGHFKAVAYTEELVGGQKIKCDRCHRTMEMFFISE